MDDIFSSDYEWETEAWKQLIKQIDKINKIQQSKGSQFYIYGIGVGNVDTAEGSYMSFAEITHEVAEYDIMSDIVSDADKYFTLYKEATRMWYEDRKKQREQKVIYGKFDKPTAARNKEQDPEE